MEFSQPPMENRIISYSTSVITKFNVFFTAFFRFEGFRDLFLSVHPFKPPIGLGPEKKTYPLKPSIILYIFPVFYMFFLGVLLLYSLYLSILKYLMEVILILAVVVYRLDTHHTLSANKNRTLTIC